MAGAGVEEDALLGEVLFNEHFLAVLVDCGLAGVEEEGSHDKESKWDWLDDEVCSTVAG